MATSLNGTTPQATYTSLLKLGDNSALSASLKRISDGAGNDTPMEISTTAVQFGGSTGMFWDNTNRRLGINTSFPSRPLTVSGASRLYDLNIGLSTNTSIGNTSNIIANWGNTGVGVASGSAITPTATFQVRGAGATSATSALLVQNSASTELFKVLDNGSVSLGTSSSVFVCDAGGTDKIRTSTVGVGIEGAPVTSAALAVTGTTKGFLPPRMTTTQKNAIATPAAGLVVYDTTTNKLCCYNGTTWNDLF